MSQLFSLRPFLSQEHTLKEPRLCNSLRLKIDYTFICVTVVSSKLACFQSGRAKNMLLAIGAMNFAGNRRCKHSNDPYILLCLFLKKLRATVSSYSMLLFYPLLLLALLKCLQPIMCLFLVDTYLSSQNRG